MTVNDYLNIIVDAVCSIKELAIKSANKISPEGSVFNLVDYFTAKEIKNMPKLKDGKMRYRPDGVWEIRYRRDGYNKSFCAKKQKDALEKFKAFIKEVKDEEKDRSKTTSKETFGFWMQRALELKKPLIKKESFITYEKICSKYLARFSNVNIAKIKPGEIQEIVNELYSAGKTRTIIDVKIVAGYIFDCAFKNGALKVSPIPGVTFPKHYRKNGSALTRTEETTLLKGIRENYFENVIKFMLYSGARRAEAVQITAQNINLKDNVVLIPCAKLKGNQGKVYREIPIFPKLKEICLKIVNGSARLNVSPTELTKYFSKICPGHHLHELRHTFISRSKECGISNELVSTWAGHDFEGVQRGRITATVYTHFSKEFQQAEAKKLVY